ncbi:MAG: hypothetical protein LBH44_12150 [Treponema sp.]|nr:hypothetical protein [Treponema sp.]
MTGCFTDWTGEGTIVINLGGGSERSADKMPWPKSNDDPIHRKIEYEITLNGNPIGSNVKAGETIRQTVPAGTYTVIVKAFLTDKTLLSPDGIRFHYATGKKPNVVVKPGQTAQADITMSGEGFCNDCKFETREPGCTVRGALIQSCNNTKHNHNGKEHPPHKMPGHLWSDWVETIPPECEKEGKGDHYCLRCDLIKNGDTIPALEHIWEWIDTTPADGTQTKTCSLCGAKDGTRITGTNWTAVTNSTFSTQQNIFGIAYGNGKFVAVGDSGKMAHSDDGINWTVVTTTTFGQLICIVYGGGKFVAGNNAGWIVYSTDGITWTAIPAGTGAGTSTFGTLTIWRIAYGDGKFVAAGSNGKMAYLTDGINNWTAVTNTTFDNDINIVYAGGKFVAGGSNGKMAYSNDGINWTAINNTTFGTTYVRGIAYGGGRFVAIGFNGRMAYSE